MTTEIAVHESVTADGEIIEHRAPMTLFGTDQPDAVVERASTVATALAKVIKERKLSSRISGKDHVNVEGWTLLGSMLGVFAEVEWSRPLDSGWEARAVARTLDGRIVGAAEAMCSTSEYRWGKADAYAVRSMAQTRAVSKALRLPLGFLMHLAGYSATPAEELADEQPERGNTERPGGATAGRSTPPPAQRTPEEQQLADELLALTSGKGRQYMEHLADKVGVPAGQRATADQLRDMIYIAFEEAAGAPANEQPVSEPAEVESAAPESVPPQDSDAPPPKPGTDEYKALEATKKAAARAYWSTHPGDEPTLAEQLQVTA